MFKNSFCSNTYYVHFFKNCLKIVFCSPAFFCSLLKSFENSFLSPQFSVHFLKIVHIFPLLVYFVSRREPVTYEKQLNDQRTRESNDQRNQSVGLAHYRASGMEGIREAMLASRSALYMRSQNQTRCCEAMRYGFPGYSLF